MPLPNHINPDHFLDLDREQSISREEGMAAWEQAYARLGEALHALGKTATLYVVFGLQGGGKSTWIAGNAPRLGEWPRPATQAAAAWLVSRTRR